MNGNACSLVNATSCHQFDYHPARAPLRALLALLCPPISLENGAGVAPQQLKGEESGGESSTGDSPRAACAERSAEGE